MWDIAFRMGRVGLDWIGWLLRSGVSMLKSVRVLGMLEQALLSETG